MLPLDWDIDLSEIKKVVYAEPNGVSRPRLTIPVRLNGEKVAEIGLEIMPLPVRPGDEGNYHIDFSLQTYTKIRSVKFFPMPDEENESLRWQKLLP